MSPVDFEGFKLKVGNRVGSIKKEAGTLISLYTIRAISGKNISFEGISERDCRWYPASAYLLVG